MASVFLNSKDWARIGCNNQQIRFLQFLKDNLGTTNTSDITSINTSIAELEAAIAAIEMTETVEQEDIPQGLEGMMKKLDHRITQLEDAP